MKDKIQKHLRRKRRTRSRVFGTKSRPRVSVYRSSKHLYVQIIDDVKGETLVSVSDLELKKKTDGKKVQKKSQSKDTEVSGVSKTDLARTVGELLAKKAEKKKIKKIVFDRGGYKYHGRVKAVAEGARKGGLVF